MTHKFFHSFTKLFLALAITVAGVSSALAADGALDPTFGTGGKVIADLSDFDSGNDVALQTDGKLIVAGSSLNGNDIDFALTRYNRDGSLDTTFGIGGKVTTDFGGDRFDHGYAVTIQPDGKIIMAGESNVSANISDFAVARYNTDGSLDTTFDSDGKVITDFSNFARGADIVLQPDGKIVVAGASWDGNNFDFALASYNTDGSLDMTFDTDGKVTLDLGGFDQGSAVVLQPDGKIVVAGTMQNLNFNTSDFALARFNSDGSVDNTFDSDGKVTTDFASSNDIVSDVTIQQDGKIVIAGSSEFKFALTRYNSDGSLDTTFDTDGKVITDFGTGSAPFENDGGEAITLQPDGKIVAAGSSNADFALARYNMDGSLDMSFDTDGKVTTDFGGLDIGYAVAIQTDGKIVMAGSSSTGIHPDIALARYDVGTSSNEVTIDVKPGRFPNRIDIEKNLCKDDDNLYVAILTTPDFDALTVDTSTLSLGDPNLNGIVNPVRNRARDVDLDGDMDLALAFSLCELVTHEALNTSSTELVLTGTTVDGVSIMGRDSVKVVRDD